MKRKIFLGLFLIITLLACSNSNFSNQVNKNNSKQAIDLIEGDNKDLKNCSILLKQGKWENNGNWNGYEGRRESWGRSQSWLWPYGNMRDETGVDLYYNNFASSILNDAHKALIYVGKWHYSPKIKEEIRLVAYQIKDGKDAGHIGYQFESMNSANKKIKEKPLSLVKEILSLEKNKVCTIKWLDKFGYNGVAENYRRLKPGFWNLVFRNYEVVITGKIIEEAE